MQSIVHDLIIIFFIAACSSCFSYLLDYALGKPGATFIEDVNERSIFFFWSLFLAKRRTKITNPYLTNSSKKELFAAGRDLFFWEFAAGMCIFCTNVWVSLLLFALPIYFFDLIQLNNFSNIFLLLTTPIFSHFILRKI
jgi:hypothetical protein